MKQQQQLIGTISRGIEINETTTTTTDRHYQEWYRNDRKNNN